MKLLLCLIAIIITIFVCNDIVNAQDGPILYANFIPYGSNSDCTGDIIGVGYSLTAENCYSDIAHNEYSNNNYEGEDGTLNNYSNEWLIVVDALRVGVAEFETSNKTCTGAFVNTQSIKNGSCVITPPFMRYNGTVNGYPLSEQYSIVTISQQPYFVSNTQVYSQFTNDGGCSSTESSTSTPPTPLLYMMYSTAGLKYVSNTTIGDEFVIQCSSNGDASIYVCKDGSSNCQTIGVTLPCTPSDDSFNQIYCTP